MNKIIAVALILGLLIIYSCNDGSIIGNDLLDDEAVDLVYLEDFDLQGQTIKGDSVPTYSNNATNQTYMVGQLDEDVFGISESDIYLGFGLLNSFPDYTDANLDSLVLELEYDTLGFYGDTNAIYTFEVYRVVEDWIDIDTIYSDESFAIDIMPIATKTIRPSATRAVPFKLRDLDNDSIVDLSPRLRIPIDLSFALDLLQNEGATESDTTLRQDFKGLYIKATVSNSSMIGFNFNENTNFNNTSIGKLTMYYNTVEDGETELLSYNYGLRAQTYSEFNHSYEFSLVNDYIKDEIDDYLFVQGMEGVMTEIRIPDLTDIFSGEDIINSARLQLTISEESQFDTDIYPPARRFLLSKYDSIGNRRLIDDAIKIGLTASNGLEILGGRLENTTDEDGNNIKTVTFTVTDYIRNLIENDVTEGTVIISNSLRQESPRRTVFYGPDHSKYPAKLRIAYSNL